MPDQTNAPSATDVNYQRQVARDGGRRESDLDDLDRRDPPSDESDHRAVLADRINAFRHHAPPGAGS